jgi:hypothetical protein
MEKCPACKGTGFVDGKICFCITKEGPKIMTDEEVMDFFKGAFVDKNVGKSK